MGFWKRIFSKEETFITPSEEKKEFVIYLIDDDEMVRKTFELYYKTYKTKPIFEQYPLGLAIHTFEKSDDLLQALRDKTPDLLILDYYLQPTDEYSSGNELREDIIAKYPKLRMAILSGLEDGDKVLDMIQKGLRDYIIKDKNMYDNVNKIILEMNN